VLGAGRWLLRHAYLSKQMETLFVSCYVQASTYYKAHSNRVSVRTAKMV
jgi:hypothetical protein